MFSMTFAQWLRRFVSRLFGSRTNTTAPRANALTAPRANALIATKEDAATRRRLLAGFVVTAGPGVTEAQREAFEDRLVSALRLAEAMSFDADIPLIGGRSILPYLRANVREFRATASGNATNDLGAKAILLPIVGAPSATEIGDMNRAGVDGVLLVIAHEARHLQEPALGHNGDDYGNICGSDLYCRSMGLNGPINNDSSLSYGGAWALHYYLALWMADHAPGWFSSNTTDALRANAENIRTGRISDIRFRGSVTVRNFPVQAIASAKGKQRAND